MKKAHSQALITLDLTAGSWVETAGIEFASDQSARQPKISNYNRDAATAIPVRVLCKCLFRHRDSPAFRTLLGHSVFRRERRKANGLPIAEEPAE
jgi:hypothetical protein